MIKIGVPTLKKTEDKVRLCAYVTISDAAYQKWVARIKSMKRYKGYEEMYCYHAGEKEVWYEVDFKYEQYLCLERSDAFVLAILYFAMITGEDIECKGVVSEEFLHNVNTYLIPLNCNERTEYRQIHIFADSTTECLNTLNKNGTGISCGVDSFDTVLTYLDKGMDQTHKLSILSVFNAGAFHGMPDMQKCIRHEMSIEEWHSSALDGFNESCIRGKQVAEQLGLEFVSVNSNVSDLYQGVFLQSHAYRNCSCVLALQKLFSHYYYASAGEIEKTYVGLGEDASDNVNLFSSDTVRFYLSNPLKTRIEKIKYISDYDIVRKNLHVCCEEIYNCGKCEKCRRTLTILDVLGKLDIFKSSFLNISEFRKKGWKNYIWVLDQLKSDGFAKDLYEYMNKNQIKIPCMARIVHYSLPLRRLINELKKKKR